jgi:hypothetical protein
MEIKEKACFIPILRLMERISPEMWEKGGRAYSEKLVACLEKEGYMGDVKLVKERIRAMNGEPVAMATMD